MRWVLSVCASFDYSAFLELAITDLEKRGIAREHILAVPLDKRVEERFGISDHGELCKRFSVNYGATIVNSMTHLNQAIIYGFNGHHLEQLQLTVDLNKYALLAAQEDSMIVPFKIGTWDIGFVEKRNPWVAGSLVSPHAGPGPPLYLPDHHQLLLADLVGRDVIYGPSSPRHPSNPCR